MENIEDKIICECGNKTVKQAIDIFLQTDLPYKKAKKLVTECDKSCCRVPLMKLFDMVYFGKVDLQEIDTLLTARKDKLNYLLSSLLKVD
ncbi:MAG: hypothetical protein HXX81_01055 [Campylobacterales bacterium]|nr:hypothetical protein [Campylobacterales bacterium]